MGTIGVGYSLDERWDANQPECGEDACDSCEACLGCEAGSMCPDDEVSGFHIWSRTDGEVRLV